MAASGDDAVAQVGLYGVAGDDVTQRARYLHGEQPPADSVRDRLIRRIFEFHHLAPSFVILESGRMLVGRPVQLGEDNVRRPRLGVALAEVPRSSGTAVALAAAMSIEASDVMRVSSSEQAQMTRLRYTRPPAAPILGERFWRSFLRELTDSGFASFHFERSDALAQSQVAAFWSAALCVSAIFEPVLCLCDCPRDADLVRDFLDWKGTLVLLQGSGGTRSLATGNPDSNAITAWLARKETQPEQTALDRRILELAGDVGATRLQADAETILRRAGAAQAFLREGPPITVDVRRFIITMEEEIAAGCDAGVAESIERYFAKPFSMTAVARNAASVDGSLILDLTGLKAGHLATLLRWSEQHRIREAETTVRAIFASQRDDVLAGANDLSAVLPFLDDESLLRFVAGRPDCAVALLDAPDRLQSLFGMTASRNDEGGERALVRALALSADTGAVLRQVPNRLHRYLPEDFLQRLTRSEEYQDIDDVVRIRAYIREYAVALQGASPNGLALAARLPAPECCPPDIVETLALPALSSRQLERALSGSVHGAAWALIVWLAGQREPNDESLLERKDLPSLPGLGPFLRPPLSRLVLQRPRGVFLLAWQYAAGHEPPAEPPVQTAEPIETIVAWNLDTVSQTRQALAWFLWLHGRDRVDALEEHWKTWLDRALYRRSRGAECFPALARLDEALQRHPHMSAERRDRLRTALVEATLLWCIEKPGDFVCECVRHAEVIPSKEYLMRWWAAFSERQGRDAVYRCARDLVSRCWQEAAWRWALLDAARGHADDPTMQGVANILRIQHA